MAAPDPLRRFLPLHIRSRVLKAGPVLLAKDEDALYELATRTAKAFGDFKPQYRRYLEAASVERVLHAWLYKL